MAGQIAGKTQPGEVRGGKREKVGKKRGKMVKEFDITFLKTYLIRPLRWLQKVFRRLFGVFSMFFHRFPQGF